MQSSTRAGIYMRQPAGYDAFVPVPLPPAPPISIDPELLMLLSNADQALGRFDGATDMLPDPELFVRMYVRQEAVLSSQIEGTQTTLGDVLDYEIDGEQPYLPQDVREVGNYVTALQHGTDLLNHIPICQRMVLEMHAILMDGVRGKDRSPGRFRTTQNFIGSGGSTLHTAEFIPPPPHEVPRLLSEFDAYINTQSNYPVLIDCALMHAQFETIHPFLDGNGRIGRLLISLLMSERKVHQRQILYLSTFLKQHRNEYYDRLMAIRHHGDWEGWLRFFLRGVHETAASATVTASQIVSLREECRTTLREQKLGDHAAALLEYLFEHPVVSAAMVHARLGVSTPAVNKLFSNFERLGILVEYTGAARNRRYRFDPYLALFPDARPSRRPSAVPLT